MKKLLFALLVLFTLQPLAAQTALTADDITGTWHSEGGDVGLEFEIFKAQGKYFGKLLWASTMYEADGKTVKKDFNNPNKNLRTRSRQNIVNITSLRYEDNEYIEGKLYNPDDGRTYSLKAKLKAANQLEFRGYIGISLLGQTMKFKRVKPNSKN